MPTRAVFLNASPSFLPQRVPADSVTPCLCCLDQEARGSHCLLRAGHAGTPRRRRRPRLSSLCGFISVAPSETLPNEFRCLLLPIAEGRATQCIPPRYPAALLLPEGARLGASELPPPAKLGKVMVASRLLDVQGFLRSGLPQPLFTGPVKAVILWGKKKSRSKTAFPLLSVVRGGCGVSGVRAPGYSAMAGLLLEH